MIPNEGDDVCRGFALARAIDANADVGSACQRDDPRLVVSRSARGRDEDRSELYYDEENR